jgi:hypothetical protein
VQVKLFQNAKINISGVASENGSSGTSEALAIRIKYIESALYDQSLLVHCSIQKLYPVWSNLLKILDRFDINVLFSIRFPRLPPVCKRPSHLLKIRRFKEIS